MLTFPHSSWAPTLLFRQVDGSLQMKPHPDEVDAVKWVTLEEMDGMMADGGAYSQRFSMSLIFLGKVKFYQPDAIISGGASVAVGLRNALPT